MYGLATGGSGVWTDTGESACNSGVRRHLLCFGRDVYSNPTPSAGEGRLAFLTTDVWAPGGGIEDADAFCRAEATQAGLDGDFAALLATSSTSAAERFDTDGLPWYRVDGVLLSQTTADLFSSELLATLNVTAIGRSYLLDRPVWTGTTDLLQSTNDHTCNDWIASDAMSSGEFGTCSRTERGAEGFVIGSGSPGSCDSAFRLYCLER